MWGCPTGRMGEPAGEGSLKEARGEAGGTGATKKETEGTEMGRARGVKERSLLPVDWAGLKESRSL